MKNDLTTGAWQHDIGCPISITLLSTSDVLSGLLLLGEQHRLWVKNNWTGRVESPPSRRDLCYIQGSKEKARTSDDVICQRAPCMFDGGSKISFDSVAKETTESPTVGHKAKVGQMDWKDKTSMWKYK